MKPSDVQSSLAVLVKKQRPAFIWGPPGAGKSDVVAAVARSLDMELRDVRLSLLDPTDLKGFPVPDTKAGVMRWLPADFLPSPKDKSRGILFLDEMNSAPPAMQAAGYQLVLNRRIGDYVLPEGWSIIAAGNREGDRSVVNRMPAALANRLVHVDFEVNLDDWCKWAYANGVQTMVVAFLRHRPELLHKFDTTGAARAFPSPRTWAFVSQIYDSPELTSDQQFELLKGTIGEGPAGEFIAFASVAAEMPNPDAVLLKPETTPIPKNLSAQYAIVSAMVSRTSANNFGQVMKYIARMSKEFQVVYIKDAVARDPEIVETREFCEWGIENSSAVT